ncbi:hypothetical protein T11_9526 [Trichinella zimbabwensis]|uniref:Uncharacterized protein n=1 Tax=Trichinella zimbabwensis TaxID=268475 RepID=A0A0V1I4U6_9BILA|nr:hypothetical protein T11_9526 [Trichinella zimbabwensis]
MVFLKVLNEKSSCGPRSAAKTQAVQAELTETKRGSCIPMAPNGAQLCPGTFRDNWLTTLTSRTLSRPCAHVWSKAA